MLIVAGIPIWSYMHLSQQVSIGDPNTARWRVLCVLRTMFHTLVSTPFGIHIYDAVWTGRRTDFRRKCNFTALVLVVMLPIVVAWEGAFGMEEMRYAMKVPVIALRDIKNTIWEVPKLLKLWKVAGMYQQDNGLDGLFESQQSWKYWHDFLFIYWNCALWSMRLHLR